MDKKKFPREGVDGVEGVDQTRDGDVEGHVVPDGLNRGPGTGGDAFPRRPSSGGEFVDENDVEGHVVPDGFTHGPGTGGDAFPRRPSGGGEVVGDDVEGHVV
jgi:hypothetical protein